MRAIFLWCSLLVVLMFGVSFAMAPLYRLLCKATGWSGKLNLTPVLFSQSNVKSRLINVQFITMNNGNLPWTFYPVTSEIKTHIGENTRVMFFIQNNADATMTVQAIPGITPWQAAKYFRKIECFCFKKQTLAPHESKMMPVVFRIEEGVPKGIETVTLAYTLFGIIPPFEKGG